MPTTGSGSASAVTSPAAGAYPDAADLRAAVQALNLEFSAGDLASFPYEAKLDAAVGEFEEATGHQPFLAAASASARTFDSPAGGERFLWFDTGLASLTSVTMDDGDTTLTSGTDFYLYPANAAGRGRPYLALEYAVSGRVYWWGSGVSLGAGSSRAVTVTGRWGYATTLPAAAREAIISKALLLMSPEIVLSITGGLYSMQEETTTTRYSGSGNTPLQTEIALWQKTYDDAVARYRLPLTVY